MGYAFDSSIKSSNLFLKNVPLEFIYLENQTT